MAVTVTTDLSQVWDGSSATNWTSNRGVSSSTEVYIQNGSALAAIVAKNTDDTWTYNYYADNGNTTFDCSGTDAHLYVWLKCDIAVYTTAIEIGVESATGSGGATSGISQWIVSNNNYPTGPIDWYGEWRCFVVDLGSTPDSTATTGTTDLANISTFRVRFNNSNSGNIRSIENSYVDVCRVGTGLTATGTTFSLADIAADDDLATNKYGILQNINGVLFSQGRLTIGNGATTTTLTSDNELLVFTDAPVSSTLYQLNFVGSGNTSVIKNGVFRSAGTTANARFVFDADDTNITFTMSGMTINRAGLTSFAAGDSITNNVFNDCLQINPSTATFQNNTISNYTGTEGGALLWPTSGNTSNITFINNNNGVEIPQSTNQSFSGMIFDDVTGKYDVNATGGSAIEVAKTNGSNPNSYNPGGSVVTFTANFNLTLTDIPSGVNVTIVNSSTRAELQHTTSTGLDITYTHGGGTTVDILLNSLTYDPNLSDIYNLTLPNSDSSIKFQMLDDLNYDNPA